MQSLKKIHGSAKMKVPLFLFKQELLFFKETDIFGHIVV